MPFHPVTVTTEVNIRYSINAQQCENVIHYQWNNSIAPTAAELLSLATEVYQTIGLKLMAAMHQGCIMREVYCRNLDTPTSPQATYTQTPPYLGQQLGTRIPNQNAKSIEKKTGLTGRSHHGGIRISGLVNSLVTSDEITPALFTLLANIIISLVANRVGGRFIPGVASKTLGDTRRITSLLVPHAIIGSTDSRTEPSH